MVSPTSIMQTANSTPDFSLLERQSQKQQREYFESVRGEFKTQTVSAFSKNVQEGDHLVFPRERYNHHGICISHEGERPVIAEYTGPSSTIRGSGKFLSCSDVGAIAIVKKTIYTYEELEKQKVYKKIWPQFLLRYRVDVITSRAKGRVGETMYGILENNCEHFVFWCICGLNVSLQVKERHFCIRETLFLLCALVMQVIEKVPDLITSLTSPELIKPFAANITDELASWIGENLTKYGFCVGAALEGVFAIYGIVKALCMRRKGTCTARERNEKVVEVVSKGSFRLLLGIGGSVGGCALSPFIPRVPPVVGSLVGGVIGAVLGHVIGYCISRWYKNRYSKVPVASEPATERTQLIASELA